MAELLVMFQDPPVEHPKAFKKGYVVDIKEDGHRWGAEEKPPLFKIIKVPGVPKKDLEWLCEVPFNENPTIEAELPSRMFSLHPNFINNVDRCDIQELSANATPLVIYSKNKGGHILRHARKRNKNS